MKYTFEKIKTIGACNALLTVALEKKQKLESRRRRLAESIDTFRKRLEKISSESAVVLQSLAAFTVAYSRLPEGKHKLTMNIRIKRLELHQARLQVKACTYNAKALLARELKYNKLDSQVSALAHYISAVQKRITAIGKAPARVGRAAALRTPVRRHNATQPNAMQIAESLSTWLPIGVKGLVGSAEDNCIAIRRPYREPSPVLQ